ncbi:MAG TPA: M14 family metallopeptidase [Longimicrobium sp.]|nr:M14 family metallopeptidase [Longimicrobium sp.]
MARTVFSGAAALLPALFAAAAAHAQPAPPSPEQVLGYALGERFTPYAGVQQYARALAAAAPDRVRYQPYGQTYEGRELFQLVIARPDVMQRLDAVLAANAELTRPETSAARAAQVAATNPAVVYFSYGVHGNESSSSEAAMWTAWDLARGAPEVRGVLDQLVVVIDPVTNPDGRDRYVNWYRSVRGARPNPDPQSREHREPWPGGRFNHYLFDLNRDWSWGTQRETRQRLATWWRWNPQVHVDFHEMFFNSSYFFFPATAPINPIYPDYVLRWGRRFGQANAQAFDRQGWSYYTAEEFDLFYPGYGDSWPSLTGAIGMTYEQAGHGAAGQAVARTDGDTLTLRERAMHHWTSGEATLRAAMAGKTQLLTDYASAARTAGAGEQDFLLVPGTDPTRAQALVAHLRMQGVEVERAGAGFGAGARAYAGFPQRGQFPAGTYRVRAKQRLGRLAVTLLQQETPLRANFSYDISAWSLPYAYGVAAYRVNPGVGGGWQPVAAVSGDAGPSSVNGPAPAYGYLVLPGAEQTAAVMRFLDAGGRVRVLGKAATFGGRKWPAGTWFIPARGNDSLQARAARAGLGAFAVSVATGHSEEGIDLGSENVRAVKRPRLAVVSGEGVDPSSFGALWFFLDQQLGMNFDAIDAADLARADLGQYDVIVLPDASPRAIRGAADTLRAFVQRGGRLVALAGAAEAFAETAGIKTREAAADSASIRARYLVGREERERQEFRQEVPGMITTVTLDPAHPLAFGAGQDGNPAQTFVLHQGSLVFEPGEGIESVAWFPETPQRLSGVISPENLRRLRQGAWLVSKEMGRGSVVLFADDPLFRLFWRSSQPLLLNAILLGP